VSHPYRLHEPIIGTWTKESAAWPVNNKRLSIWQFNTGRIAAIDGRVFRIPFVIQRPFLISGFLGREGTSSNSSDFGVYDEALQLVIATGNANRGTGTNYTGVADTVIPPGMYYFCASANATDNLIFEAMTYTGNEYFYPWHVGQRYSDVGAGGNPLPADLSGQTWVDDVTSTGILVMGVSSLGVG
jgi:hypothetical protein